MPSNKNILISGAGISGLTLAYWLHKWGFSPTLIEKRPDLDDRGYMIDFYGSGFDVADKMGLIPTLEAKSDQYQMTEVSFVDRQNKTRAAIDMIKFRSLLDHKYFPVMRGDLEMTIYDAIKEIVPIQFGTTITSIKNQSAGVIVELSNGKTETYDLVIGTDGIHSGVRNLLWGDESQFNRFLGFYVACSVIDNFFDNPHVCYGHFEPNIQTTVYSIGANKLANFFAFRSELIDVHSHDVRMKVLMDTFEDRGWVYPQLLDETQKADHLFFDAVAQIQLEQWHKERVALVGDACQCLTLLAGQGASMGMAGAYMLADELHKADGDYKVAFPSYQQKLKPEIERRQKDARGLAGSFVPRNKFEVGMTHFFLNAAFVPGFSILFKNQIGAKSIIK